MNNKMKFSAVRYDKNNNALKVKGMTFETMKASVLTEMKSKPVQKFRNNLPVFETLGAGFVRQAVLKLPWISVAASWKKSDSKQMEVSSYNGIVLLNVRKLASIEEAETVKQLAQSQPSTFATFIGSSGKSVKILVSVSLPDGSLPTDIDEAIAFHQQAYYLAYTTFSGVVSYSITREDPNLRQGFRMTYDPKAVFNTDVHPLKVNMGMNMELKEDDEMQGLNPLERYEPGADTYEEFEKRFRVLLQMTSSQLEGNALYTNKELYISTLAKNCCLVGFPQEEALLHTFNLYVRDMDRETIRSIFESVYVAFSDKYGSKPVYNKTQQNELLFHRYMNDRYVLRYNTLKEVAEYRDNNSWSLFFQPIDERKLSQMILEARRRGISVTERDLLRYVKSSDVSDYDPVDDYLISLNGVWDGKDHIGAMAHRIKTDNPHWEQWFRIWFRGLVAQWRGWNSQYGNSVAPIIIGPQGWRKSTFCRQLLPPELAFGFTDQLDFGNRRDIDLTISHYLLVNIDEFDQLTKHAQNGYLKNLLQRTDSKQRKLFTDSVNEKRRYASFIGTSNISDLLTDATGGRRFLCVEITAPIDTKTPINYRQLYAQAVAELDAKLPYWFTEEEVKVIMDYNRNFMELQEQEVLFNEYFRAPEHEDEGEWLSPTEILTKIKKTHKNLKISLRDMGRYLRNMPDLPFRKSHSNNQYKVVWM